MPDKKKSILFSISSINASSCKVRFIENVKSNALSNVIRKLTKKRQSPISELDPESIKSPTYQKCSKQTAF